ncbi:MAG TPA: zf-HC2 domain-containing protein [Pyrinomonadaceae bacterium]|nr:zf-HC2 domain-containing protein [Pyrinomonadaceae bacterium]
MNEKTNNEMDLLLRRLGRRPDKSVADANGDIDHLDADELSAYAENVLPAAARARYTMHLAECARCRELVTQLSSSAGVVPVVETVNPPVPSALRKFLANLFSPLVMRYAVPALGLIVVAAIGLFVLQRNKQESAQIAQNAEPSKYTSLPTPDSSAGQVSSGVVNDQVKKEPAANKAAQSSGSPGNQAAGAAPEAQPIRGVGDFATDEQAKRDQPVAEAAPAPAAATAPKPTPTPDTAERQAKTEPREEATQVQAANEPPKEKAAQVKVEDRKKAEVNVARSTESENKSFGSLTTLQPGTVRAKQRDDAEDKDKNAETKTVAGRHFRKRGKVWIDTAYDSSRSVLTFSRGSEGYRSLIADEPAIKTIADELDGEIIVVWKGHTYRIQ